MRDFILPDICDPEVVYGIISGLPIHDSYPIELTMSGRELFNWGNKVRKPLLNLLVPRAECAGPGQNSLRFLFLKPAKCIT
jgi:hypothetical protein